MSSVRNHLSGSISNYLSSAKQNYKTIQTTELRDTCKPTFSNVVSKDYNQNYI
jgi:hypothetical protein